MFYVSDHISWLQSVLLYILLVLLALSQICIVFICWLWNWLDICTFSLLYGCCTRNIVFSSIGCLCLLQKHILKAVHASQQWSWVEDVPLPQYVKNVSIYHESEKCLENRKYILQYYYMLFLFTTPLKCFEQVSPYNPNICGGDMFPPPLLCALLL